MKDRVLAICLKTYPDEDDMQMWCDGQIELCDVKIYYKGKKYLVVKGFDKKYYKVVEQNKANEPNSSSKQS